MKKYLIIPGALLAFILFSAKSCKEDPQASWQQEEAAIAEKMDSVKNEFGGDFLDEESLFVFSRKAKQKLIDYADYMNIVNDSSLDSAFRDQAWLMALDLFANGLVPGSLFPGKVTLIDSSWISEPLKLAGEGVYKGELGFREKILQKPGEDSTIFLLSYKTSEIICTKSPKVFGTDTLSVWQVFLGKIYLLPTP